MISIRITSEAQLKEPVLKEGSKGEAVKELQQLLLNYGAYVFRGDDGACVYPGVEVIDGIFGSKTTAAVKLFQGKMSLVEDGIVGDKTWRSLFQGAPDVPVLELFLDMVVRLAGLLRHWTERTVKKQFIPRKIF